MVVTAAGALQPRVRRGTVASFRLPWVAPYRGWVSELAQVNVALMRAPLSDPSMARFVDAFDPVNRLAEASPGFVWRLRSAGGHATVVAEAEAEDGAEAEADAGADAEAGTGDGHADAGRSLVANVSVWRDYPSLHAFAYRSAHGGFVRHRSRWFLPTPQPSTALWWIRSGERPDVEEAVERLNHLRTHGPSPRAFSLRRQFDAQGRRTGQARGGASTTPRFFGPRKSRRTGSQPPPSPR